ncbi:WD40 repeat domain-containing protein [bacterium]|nr:WD40 repeat domain-containing protein [bacterium]
MKKLLLSLLFCLNCVFGCFAGDDSLESKDDPAPSVPAVVVEPAYRVEQPPEGFVRFVASEGIGEHRDPEAFVDIPREALLRAECLKAFTDVYTGSKDNDSVHPLPIVRLEALRGAVHCLINYQLDDGSPDRAQILRFTQENRLSFLQRVDLLKALDSLGAFDFSNVISDSIILMVRENGLQCLIESRHRLPSPLRETLIKRLNLRLMPHLERSVACDKDCNESSGIAVSPDGERFAMVDQAFRKDYAPVVRVFDRASGREVLAIDCVTAYIEDDSIKWSPSANNLLAIAPLVGCVKVFNTDTGVVHSNLLIDDMEGIERAVRGFCWSSDGNEIAVVFGNGNCYKFDVETGRVINSFLFGPPANDFLQYNLSYSPDGSRLSIGDYSTIKVFDCVSTELLYQRDGLLSDWSNNGSKLAMTSEGIVVVVDAVSWETLYEIDEHRDTRLVCWSMDDKYVIPIPFRGRVNVWDGNFGGTEPVFVGPELTGTPFRHTYMVGNRLFVQEERSISCLNLSTLETFSFSRNASWRVAVLTDLNGHVTFLGVDRPRVWSNPYEDQLSLVQKVFLHSIFSGQVVSWDKAKRLKSVYMSLPIELRARVNSYTRKFQLLRCCC